MTIFGTGGLVFDTGWWSTLALLRLIVGRGRRLGVEAIDHQLYIGILMGHKRSIITEEVLLEKTTMALHFGRTVTKVKERTIKAMSDEGTFQ